jgi:nucleotide-binding universal stress UspA family protein
VTLVRSIVVGTDFSPESRRAVGYAADFAKALGASLAVVHVDEKAAFVPGSDLAETELAEDRAAMEEHLREVRSRDVPVRGIVRPGLPAEGLCDTVRDLGADLLIIGESACGVADVVLGGIAPRVLRAAPCPVLVVRHP